MNLPFTPDLEGKTAVITGGVGGLCAAFAKAAVSNFTRWLAVYFAKIGIRVNAMAPGFFVTAQNAALLWLPDGSPTPRTQKILDTTPMGRFGEPEELIGTLLWIIDNGYSGFVTGVVVSVDGGFSAYSGA